MPTRVPVRVQCEQTDDDEILGEPLLLLMSCCWGECRAPDRSTCADRRLVNVGTSSDSLRGTSQPFAMNLVVSEATARPSAARTVQVHGMPSGRPLTTRRPACSSRNTARVSNNCRRNSTCVGVEGPSPRPLCRIMKRYASFHSRPGFDDGFLVETSSLLGVT